MSTAPKSPLLNSGIPTRQQLDELDALMQRMLSIPAHSGEEEEAGSQVEAVAGATNEKGRPVEGRWSAPAGPGDVAERMTNAGDGSFSAPSTWAAPTAPDPRFDFGKAAPNSFVQPDWSGGDFAQVDSPAHLSVRSTVQIVESPPESNGEFESSTDHSSKHSRTLTGRDLLGGLGIACLVLAVAWSILDFLGWTW